MPAMILALADALVASLNAAAFCRPVVAVRHYLPLFEPADMSELRVSVVPRSLGSKPLDRSRTTLDCRLDVAVQHKLEPTPENLDALMELVEEIAEHVRTQPLAGFPQAKCVEVVNEPIYAPEHLEQFRLFTSVLTLTYRVWR